MQWMRLSNGREEIIVNQDHVKRLLGEGAVKIDDPRVSQEPEIAKEEASTEVAADGSTNVNEQSDSPSTPDDQRHGTDAPVQRSKRTR